MAEKTNWPVPVWVVERDLGGLPLLRTWEDWQRDHPDEGVPVEACRVLHQSTSLGAAESWANPGADLYLPPKDGD